MPRRALHWIAVASFACAIGCNASRHDMLTFFFDGVDDPPQDRWEHEREMRAAAYALEGQDDAREPYAMNPCSECHGSSPATYAAISPARETGSAAGQRGLSPGGSVPDTAVLVPRDTSPQPVRPDLDRAGSMPTEVIPAHVDLGTEHEPARSSAPTRPAPASKASIASASADSLAGERVGVPGINLQVAAFANPNNATALKEKLAAEFRAVRIDALPAHGKTWYRVRIGPIAAEAEAQSFEARLREMGYVPIRYGKAR